MDTQVRRAILKRRIEMLKMHLWLRAQPEFEAPAPLCEDAYDKAVAELEAVEQEQPRGS
jgi:hypothetical protein